jgi:hypothetical protein
LKGERATICPASVMEGCADEGGVLRHRPRRLEVLHEAEVQHLGHVREASPLAQDDVPRLDVAVHEADAVGFGEGSQHLAEDVQGATR